MSAFFFSAVILLTVCFPLLASKRMANAADFFVAGGRIGGVSNGFAVAGDFISPATLLGITRIIFGAGNDAVIYLGEHLGAFAIKSYLMEKSLICFFLI